MAPKKWQQLCLVVQLTRDRPLALAVLALALVLIPDAAASTTQTTAQAGVGRVAVSAVKLPDTSTVVRRTLTEAELAAPQRVRFTLNLRNFKELDARITRGEVLSRARNLDRRRQLGRGQRLFRRARRPLPHDGLRSLNCGAHPVHVARPLLKGDRN